MQSSGAGQDQVGTSTASQDVSRRPTDDQAYTLNSTYAATQANEAQPELSQSRSMKQAKSGRRAELEAAVARLRDALQASDPAAGQQAASEVATLLRATTMGSTSSMHAAQAAHPAQQQTEQPSRGRAPVRASPRNSPSPPRRSRSRNAMTQTNTRKPHVGSAQNTGRSHGGVSSRDAACSPPPHSRMGEPSTRFQTRPEWDDSFHLTKPVTPRPPLHQASYPCAHATTNQVVLRDQILGCYCMTGAAMHNDPICVVKCLPCSQH